MFLSDLLLALLIAVVLTLVFVPFLGWRRPGAGAAEGFLKGGLLFFSVVFLGAWAGGVWLAPWGIPWLGFLVSGLLIALIIAAIAPPPARAPAMSRGGGAAGGAPRGDVTTEEGELVGRGERLGPAELGLFFWTLLFLLAIAVAAAYIAGPAPEPRLPGA